MGAGGATCSPNFISASDATNSPVFLMSKAKIAEVLRQVGYTSVQDIFAVSVDELCNLEGLGQKTAERLKEAAKYF